MPRRPHVDKRRFVVHVGVVGDRPGGMAQVVRGYVRYAFQRVRVVALCSTSGRRDLLAPLRCCNVLVRLTVIRIFQREVVVVVHLSERGSFIREGILLQYARLIGFGVAAHLHGAQFVTFADQWPALVRFALRGVGTVFCLTSETEQSVAKVVGKEASVIRVKNAVRVEAIAPQIRRKVVFFAGEIGVRKGADVLLEAWQRVSSAADQWVLCLAGPFADGLCADSLRLRNVEYLGVLTHDEVVSTLRGSEVAVLPSRNEALPMFVVEAVAAGCAVVASDVGQIAEVLADGAGMLCEPADVNSLATSLQVVLSDTDLRSTLQARSVKLSADYSEEAVFAEVEDAWLSVGR